MKTMKRHLLAIIAFASAIIGGLIIFISRQNHKSADLKADISLTDRKNDSRVVDGKIDSAQGEIDKLSQEMNKPVGDEFWDEYTKDKK